MNIPKNPLGNITTDKLEKIHYIQLKVIKDREKEGKTEGKNLTINSIFQATFLRDIFIEADKAFDGKKEEFLGLHYYVASLNALPLEKVRILEIETGREIKRRREIYRQKIDAGNLDKVVRLK
jgi:hypothetical protein